MFLGRARDRGKLKKQAIFDSQEYERNVLTNLRRWLTTSSRLIIDSGAYDYNSRGQLLFEGKRLLEGGNYFKHCSLEVVP